MNEEIKEILHELDCHGVLNCRQDRELLNYITNLQKENKDNLECIKSLKEQLESVINENQKLLETWHKNNDKNINLISENEYLKETNEEHRKINGDLRKENQKLKEELSKADSITQSCIFNGKEESEISYRQCLNMLEDYKQENQKLVKVIEEAIKYNKELCEIYDCGMELSNAQTNLFILEKYKLTELKGGSDEK